MRCYKLFTSPRCHVCPQIKEYMKTINMEGEHIDATTEEGRALAEELGIFTVPSVVFYEGDAVIGVARSIEQIKKFCK